MFYLINVDFFNVKESQMSEVASEIINFGDNLKIWTFKGDLGAGKTTLIKFLAQKYGLIDTIQSPTFSYVNEYDNSIFHFDCYRLKNIYEALDFGMEEYLESGKMCWIEWPEIIEDLLPTPHLEIKIEHTENNSRNVFFKIKS